MKSNEEMGLFGLLVGALGGNNMFPEEDANDLIAGATSIPDEVTNARRRGEKVKFIMEGEAYYWLLPNGSRIPRSL